MTAKIATLMLLAAFAAKAQTPDAAQPPADPAEPGKSKPPKKDPLKIPGYVQARYTWEQDEDVHGFTIRRARIKPTYEAAGSKYVLEIDASASGVSLREAHATFTEPWTGYDLALTAGQFKYPFGFEVHQSSSVREFPERSQVVRAFLPGERDRGAMVASQTGVATVRLGVFNGNGMAFEEDNDPSKDIIGQARVDLGWVSGGVSGWWGESFQPFDAEGGGGYHPRTRVGADVQLARRLIDGVGETELRLEGIVGQTYVRSGAEQFGVPAGGWYAVLVQAVGEKASVALRYDWFDPNLGREDTVTEGELDRQNATTRVGVALMYQLTKHLEATAAYEVPMTGTAGGLDDPDDDVFVLQFQAKF